MPGLQRAFFFRFVIALVRDTETGLGISVTHPWPDMDAAASSISTDLPKATASRDCRCMDAGGTSGINMCVGVRA